jgi:hypothetical protein
MTDQGHNEHGGHPKGYDKDRVSVAWITTIALLTIAVITTFAIVINEMFLVSKERLYEEQVLSKESTALRDLRAREQEELGSYKLLDAETGRYQIPVERAMQLMADSAYTSRLKAGQR